MSKHKRKRFLSILITAVLVFTLALSSVMAQDDEHVRTDKLSVEGESVEVMEGIVGDDDVEVIADEAITADDVAAEEADAEEAADAEEISAEDAVEEADADISDAAEDDAEADAGIIILSAGDIEDDENGIMPLADVTVTSGLQDAINAAGSGDTITLGADITESVTIASGQNITLDLNGHTLNGGGSTVITVEGTLTLKDGSSAGTGTVTGASATHGGVIVQNGGNFTLDSGTISGNSASGSGAGVYVESATFTMTGGTISDNTATRYGGGVNVTVADSEGANSTFTMTGGTISGNTASQMYGGGVFVETKSGSGESTFHMSGGTIGGTDASSGNNASYGAGVAVKGATVNLSGSALITNNTASTTTSGGGGGNMYLYDSTAKLNMTGGTISYGSAYSGGGINVAAGTVNMSGGTIDYSKSTAPSSASAGGGGVYVKDGATFNLSGSAVVSNSESYYSGSGFYVSGSLVMSGGTITKNTVTDTWHYSGGGVCLSGNNASFTMSGGTISENDGFSGGGGVAASGGTFTMSGGSIENNTAIYGGGVDAESCTITITGGSITGNIARDGTVEGNAKYAMGGGVYLSSNSYGFTVSGGAVTGNAREDETVDNVYICSGKYITLGTDLSTVPATVAASGASNQIGVTTVTDPTDTAPVRFTEVENGTEYYATSASYFFSDKGYGVRANDGAYLELYLMDFEEEYLTGDDGELYTSATADNYKQILSGASDWDALSQEEQDQITADLTDANGGEYLDYPMLLAQAQAIADEVNAFEESYLGGADSLYTEATADNYQDILAGASDWDAMSDEAKAAVNADLTAANGGVELTYEDLLAQAQAIADANAFEESYLGGADSLYTTATADNYQDILSGASDWADMSDEAKAQVNADLTAAWQEAGNTGELTYDDLLAQAFELAYLTDDSGNGPYTEVTDDNIDQILSGAAGAAVYRRRRI